MQWAERINELILFYPLLKLLCLILFSFVLFFAVVILSMLIIVSATTKHVFLKVIMSLLLRSYKLFKSLIPVSLRKPLSPLCSFFAFSSHMLLIAMSCFLKLLIQVIWVEVLIVSVFITFSISKRCLSLIILIVLLAFVWMWLILLVFLIKRVLVRAKRILPVCTHLIIILLLFNITEHIVSNRYLFKFSFSRTTCFVRMVLLRQLVILLFYFFFVSSRWNS